MFLKKIKKAEIQFSHGGDRKMYFLFDIFFISIALLVSVLLIQLFNLTIVKGSYYKNLADNNRAKDVVIEAERGTITDRKGFVMAENIKPDVNISATRIESRRVYYFPVSASHVVGYRLKADSEDIKNDNCFPKIKSGDKVGKLAVEKLFECQLRGKNGKKLVETDAKGRIKRTLSVVNEKKGQTIQLALDSWLQKKTYNLIKGKKAAVIGLNPKTGEVLVLVSSPSFNSQAFEDGNEEEIKSYSEDKDKPLFNKALQGVYPPGSTFKPVIAAAALEEGKINAKTRFEDTGIIKAGSLTFGNWYYLEYGKKEGMVDIVEAIKRSNDIFFYKVGALLGPKIIKKYALRFGFGKKSGLGLPENEGTIPSPFWKEEKIKSHWFLGDTYNLSIGQGYLLSTPMQVTEEASVFANNGVLCKPKVLKNTLNNKKDSFLRQYAEPECQSLGIKKETLALIRKGMRDACAPGGTGWPFFNFKVKVGDSMKKMGVGCKTGTAQSHSKSRLPHAWFTIFAPFNNPKIVLTVLVEESGEGSNVAAPIAKQILKDYFERAK